MQMQYTAIAKDRYRVNDCSVCWITRCDMLPALCLQHKSNLGEQTY